MNSSNWYPVRRRQTICLCFSLQRNLVAFLDYFATRLTDGYSQLHYVAKEYVFVQSTMG